MKRILIILACLVLGGLVGFSLTTLLRLPQKINPRTTVAILSPMDHPSLNEAIRGFQSQLSVAGFSEQTVQYSIYNAQGDMSKLPSLIDNIIASKPNIVLSLTTPASMQAVKKIPPEGIPVVFTAVTDPIGAGILDSLAGCMLPITGVSDRYPVPQQMDFLTKLFPTVKSVAILRNPAEQNSKLLSEESQRELEKVGIKSVIIDVATESEINAKTQQAISKHGCILINGDNLLVGNLGRVIKICSTAHVPLYVGDPDSVRKGAVAAVGPSYYSLGQQTGSQAAKILNGTFAGSLPCEFPTKYDYIINTRAADAMGVEIPWEAIETRPIWESRSGSQ